jgi:hypothetical protein
MKGDKLFYARVIFKETAHQINEPIAYKPHDCQFIFVGADFLCQNGPFILR